MVDRKNISLMTSVEPILRLLHLGRTTTDVVISLRVFQRRKIHLTIYCAVNCHSAGVVPSS
jgi:hypothetical protein